MRGLRRARRCSTATRPSAGPAGKAIVDRAVRIAFTDEMDMDDEREQFLHRDADDADLRRQPAGRRGVEGDAFAGGPRPGDRAPDAHDLRRFGVGHPLRLFELTRGTAHTLLVYADGSTTRGGADAASRSWPRRSAPDPRSSTSTSWRARTPVPADLDLPVLRDAADAFREAYGLRGAAAYLIRPDGHVGFRCAPVSAAALDEHLATIFTT